MHISKLEPFSGINTHFYLVDIIIGIFDQMHAHLSKRPTGWRWFSTELDKVVLFQLLYPTVYRLIKIVNFHYFEKKPN